MQKTIYSVAALTPVLVAGGLSQPARAEGVPQNLRTQQLYAALQGSVCRNDWSQALRETSFLIGAPEITSDSRQDLIRFRHQLEGWRAAKSSVSNIANCGNAPFEVRFQQSGLNDLEGYSQQTVSAQQLYASMQGAVCRNNWDEALGAIALLIRSPDITPAYRDQLVRFHHQLEDWRASRSQVDSVPNCQGIASNSPSPTPEMAGRLVDWAS